MDSKPTEFIKSCKNTLAETITIALNYIIEHRDISYTWAFGIRSAVFNSSSPWQNDRHFADDIFRRIFMKTKNCISIRISLKIVPNGAIDNNSAMLQIMAWRRTGDEPVSESMLTQFIDAYMRH